ncbi:MAG TPA: M48 family metallopeptidase [Clostridia bacterium]|nr:M48 family metallopeptidase [Clostridia bacterium]
MVFTPLIVLTGIFALLYLWFSLFPGRISGETLLYFTPEQVAQGRQYNLILRLVSVGSFIVQAAFLVWLVFGGMALQLSRWAQHASGGNYWGSILLFFAVLWVSLRVINLPFSFFSSYYWQHKWGFSTQTLGGWWLDYFKGAGIGFVLAAVGVILLFWAINRWPGFWWLAGAVFVSATLVVQTFLWPVLIAPLYNKFEPVNDPAVLAMVDELSQKANLPIKEVLVMDASQRTTKANAYFAGIGGTKRIVLYDTLLNDYTPEEVEAVIAHEMAHWSKGHIAKGLTWGTLGNLVLWGLLFLVLRVSIPGLLSSAPFPPHAWVLVLLFFMLVSFIGNPVTNSFSRGMEYEADSMAVELTGNPNGAISLQQSLALKNLSDLAPAPFIEWFSYSHPSAAKRIENIRNSCS